MGGKNPYVFSRAVRVAALAALFVCGGGLILIFTTVLNEISEIDGCGVNNLGSDTGVATAGATGTTGFACPPLGIFEGACWIDERCVICDCNMCVLSPGGRFQGNGTDCRPNTRSPAIGTETTGTTGTTTYDGLLRIILSRQIEDFFELSRKFEEEFVQNILERGTETEFLAEASLFLILAPFLVLFLLPFVIAAILLVFSLAYIVMLVGFLLLLSTTIVASALEN